jgi:hypothetical protein
MEPTLENIQAFKHACWRVRFTARLIALNEGLSTRGSPSWGDERVEYENRHLLAKQELAAFPRDWSSLYP